MGKNNIEIRKSNDNKVYGRVVKGKRCYYIPEDEYNEFIESQIHKHLEEKRQKEIYGQETDQMVELINKRKEAIASEQKKITPNLQITAKPKALQPPKVNKSKKTKYKGNKKINIKVLIATLLALAGIGASIYGINKYMQEQREQDELAVSLEGLTDEEILDEIYGIIKEEVGYATGESISTIYIERSVDSTMVTTKIKAGDELYRENLDLDSPLSFRNTLKSEGIRDIITQANNAQTREELIKALKNAKEFSEENDLMVKDGNLEEVSASHDDER